MKVTSISLCLWFSAQCLPIFAQDPSAPAGEPSPSAGKTSIHKFVDGVRRMTGKQLAKIVEITAKGAAPFPQAWDTVFHDSASTTYLSQQKAGQPTQPAANAYAEGHPPTYFDLNRVKVDVKQAFETVNTEATDNKVSFDNLDYQLRAREFSQEPVWTLRLVNAEQQLVGLVELSAESGRIYRSIWLRRDGGDFRVTDSALATTGATGNPKPTEEASEKDTKPTQLKLDANLPPSVPEKEQKAPNSPPPLAPGISPVLPKVGQ